MATTFELIGSTVTVGSGGASNIEFTSIPSTYTDLVIKLSARTTENDTSDYALVKFNADGGSNYPYNQLYCQATNVTANRGTLTGAALVRMDGNTATASAFGSSEIYIPSYASSLTKGGVADGVAVTNAANNVISLWGSSWTGTSAITTITITPSTGTFLQYSTASLYGIKNS